MFEAGNLVKIKPEWCGTEKEKTCVFIVVNVNPVTERCYISPVDCKLPLVPQELVGFNMIELI